MISHADSAAAPATKGRVLNHALGYDLLVWLMLFGRERVVRGQVLDAARLAPGESVLDIGCGTGTLAVAAARRLGAGSRVCGIDPGDRMIARARRKGQKAGVSADFQVGVVESMPYPDGHFDVVLSTLMMHHLPKEVRAECAREVKRVLRPGGRFFVVDFAPSPEGHGGIIGHLHRHGFVGPEKIERLLTDAGYTIRESGWVARNLHYTTGITGARA